jgi:heme A synthase
MTTEALVGAGLVLFEYVAYNVSIARAYWMAAHLINTLLLLAAMTLTAWFASKGGTLSIRRQGWIGWMVWPVLIAMALIGISGAVAALGDTLVLSGGLDPASNPVVATLVGLRTYHPFVAIIGVMILLSALHLVVKKRQAEPLKKMAMLLSFMLLLQLTIGAFNVWLEAPVILQMVHLFVTDVIWIGLVWFGASAFAVENPQRA